jgi:hypothetical protein
MHPHLMSQLARQHTDELLREAAAERLARNTDRAERPLRERLPLAALAAGASVVGALVLLAVR